MPPDANIPKAGDNPPADPKLPPVIGTTPLQAKTPGWLVGLLSITVALFLANALISLADDTLALFFNRYFLGIIRALTGLFALLSSLVVYVLMAFTPAIPKRWFMPLTLFSLLAFLGGLPFLIYFSDRLQLISWSTSVIQMAYGIWLLPRLRGSLAFRWPLVSPNRIGTWRFSWSNLFGFAAVNLFVFPIVIGIYLFICAGLALSHFSQGFMALHPGGLSVQVRTYVSDEGKTIQLFPMSHVADSNFYQQVAQSFPSNSIILMEGVTDDHNLITNKISYQRMAKTLGLAEQHEKFRPTQGKLVRADVDVSQFSKDTLDVLNLVMLIHSQGLNAGNLQTFLQFSPSPQVQDELLNDLLLKRNQHLLGEVKKYLPQSNYLMIPWGAAHMPGVSEGIQKAGFHLVQSENIQVIRFHL